MTNADTPEPLDPVPKSPGTASSPDELKSRVDSSLNDPFAAAHPELSKADKAMAEELLAHQLTLDKSALRKLSIKQAEEAKIVAETLAARERQAMENRMGPLGDTDTATTEDASRDEEDPRTAKARVPNDMPNGPLSRSDARNDDDHVAPDRSIAADRAAAFRREMDAVVGTQHYPELAGAYAVVAAIDLKAKVDGLSPQARHIVAERARDNIVASLRQDQLPRMNVVRESSTVSREAQNSSDRSTER